MSTDSRRTANQSINRHLRVALLAALMLICGVGGWAVITKIAGAVLASGFVVVDANVKKVQHPLGGVVSMINVKNGQRVEKGEVLLRLDPTVAQANLAMVTKSIDALVVRQRRLEAERDGGETISLPEELRARLEEPELASLWHTETRFFESRRKARLGLQAQLNERIMQFEQQISGLTKQTEAFTDGMELIGEELEGLEELYTKKLVVVTRLMQLSRDETEIRATHAQALAEIAQTKARISEVKLQILQVDEDLRAEATGALREVKEKMAEYVERRIAALDQLQRLEMRAPIDGVVHELAVHTVGGVIDAGAAVMLIVPDMDNLSIEVRIDVQDRDQVHLGQHAVLRMTAFDQRNTPELQGKVSMVGADLVEDQRSGLRYYPLRIALSPGEREKLGDKMLMPGMPVESFVQTRERTVLSYLTKPLTDYMTKAFRTD